MTLSLVIPTHRRPKELARLARSLSFAADDNVEVLFVGNEPSDSYIYSVGMYLSPQIRRRALMSEYVGVNRARNLGARHASGEIVVFLDDDCFFESGQEQSLNQIVQKFESDDVAVVGGNYSLPSRSSSAAKAYHVVAQNWYLQGLSLGSRNWRLFGGFLAVRRRVMDEGMSFDESIVFGGAESEFLLRCLNNGFTVVSLPEAKITHGTPMSTADLVSKAKSQSATVERYDLFQRSDFRVHELLDYKEYLLNEVSANSLEKLLVMKNIAAYEAHFDV